MNGFRQDSHLSSEQLSEWALNERSAPMVEHVESCPACRAKVERFDEALGGFRNSLHQWSESRLPRSAAGFRPPKDPVVRWSNVWVTAVACFMALTLIFIVRDAGVSKQPAQHASADNGPQLSAQEEAALLTQIDQEVSRTVPAAMDPLSSLVAGDGAHSADAHDSARNAKVQ